MNRRGFLRSLASGIVGAAVLAKIPAETVIAWTPSASLRGCVALDYLRNEFNAWCDIASKKAGTFVVPELIVAGRQLYEQAEVEMPYLNRYTSEASQRFREPNMMFKGVTMISRGDGWRATFHEVAEYATNPS